MFSYCSCLKPVSAKVTPSFPPYFAQVLSSNVQCAGIIAYNISLVWSARVRIIPLGLVSELGLGLELFNQNCMRAFFSHPLYNGHVRVICVPGIFEIKKKMLNVQIFKKKWNFGYRNGNSFILPQ